VSNYIGPYKKKHVIKPYMQR